MDDQLQQETSDFAEVAEIIEPQLEESEVLVDEPLDEPVEELIEEPFEEKAVKKQVEPVEELVDEKYDEPIEEPLFEKETEPEVEKQEEPVDEQIAEVEDGPQNKEEDSQQISEEELHQQKVQATAYELGRRQKQMFLIENVVNRGYDTNIFAYFLESKKTDGVNIDNWTFPALTRAVEHFVRAQKEGYVELYDDILHKEQEQERIEHEEEERKAKQLEQKEEEKRKRELEEDEYVDIDFDQDFTRLRNSIVNYDDCPQIEVRQFLATKKIEENRTALNFKKITIKVPASEIKKGGFFSYDYALYHVETEVEKSGKLKVSRKDVDFYTLRRLLKNQFPQIIVPPLPAKNSKLIEKVLMKRQKQFTRFLQAISRSEVLKSGKFVHDFLAETDYKQFTQIVKAEEKSKFSRNITDFASVDGQANVQLNQNSSVFCSKMSSFIDSHQILYKQVIDITADVNLQSQELAHTMFQLQTSLGQLSELSRMIKVDRQQDLYSWLGKLMQGTGQHIQNTAELVKLYLGSHLKFHLAEHEGMRELFLHHSVIKAAYLKRERSIFDRKERLFKSKDFKTWGCTAVSLDVVREKSEELFLDKQKAFKFMLTEESRQLSEQREELSFYTNQCLTECQRIGADNGEMLTEHFLTMSQIQCAYINQHHVSWADFMGHFSALGVIEDTEDFVHHSPKNGQDDDEFGYGESDKNDYEYSNHETKSHAMDRNMTMLESPEIFANALSGLSKRVGVEEESKE